MQGLKLARYASYYCFILLGGKSIIRVIVRIVECATALNRLYTISHLS